MLIRNSDYDIPPSRCPECPSERVEHFNVTEDELSSIEEWRCSFCGIRIAWSREYFKPSHASDDLICEF